LNLAGWIHKYQGLLLIVFGFITLVELLIIDKIFEVLNAFVWRWHVENHLMGVMADEIFRIDLHCLCQLLRINISKVFPKTIKIVAIMRFVRCHQDLVFKKVYQTALLTTWKEVIIHFFLLSHLGN